MEKLVVIHPELKEIVGIVTGYNSNTELYTYEWINGGGDLLTAKDNISNLTLIVDSAAHNL